MNKLATRCLTTVVFQDKRSGGNCCMHTHTTNELLYSRKQQESEKGKRESNKKMNDKA